MRLVVVTSMSPERVQFRSGLLTLWGEVWRPTGQGRFPTVLWNHGSEGRAHALQAPRTDGPTTLECWLAMGFAVFAPSRRGYDGAEGQPLGEALAGPVDRSPERGELMARRLLAESDDVLAAAAYLLDQPWVDRARLVCAGYSFGGIMTMLGLARSGDFAAGVNFASAAMTWPHYAAIRDLLLARVEQIRDPVMIIQAENDYSTAPTPALAAALERRGVEHRAIVYPAVGAGPADGHVFCALGGRIWSPDVRAFLAQVGVLGQEGEAAG